jgi:hypothetical protein
MEVERLKELIRDRDSKIESLEAENRDLKKITGSASGKASMIGQDSVVGGTSPKPSIVLVEQREQGPARTVQPSVVGKTVTVQSHNAMPQRTSAGSDLTSTTLTQSATDTEEPVPPNTREKM